MKGIFLKSSVTPACNTCAAVGPKPKENNQGCWAQHHLEAEQVPSKPNSARGERMSLSLAHGQLCREESKDISLWNYGIQIYSIHTFLLG